MKEALGLVETRGLSNAILAADAMVKTANINIIGLENTRGSGYMTIKISGDVGAVNAAVTCGKQIAIENNCFISAKVIPRPSNNIEVTFCQLNNQKDDNTKSKKNNNEVIAVETEDVIKGNEENSKKDISKNVIDTSENLENKDKEISYKLEDDEVNKIENDKVEELSETDEQSKSEADIDHTNETSINQNSSEKKVSTTEKTKPKRKGRKKSENKEE